MHHHVPSHLNWSLPRSSEAIPLLDSMPSWCAHKLYAHFIKHALTFSLSMLYCSTWSMSHPSHLIPRQRDPSTNLATCWANVHYMVNRKMPASPTNQTPVVQQATGHYASTSFLRLTMFLSYAKLRTFSGCLKR